MEYEKDPTILRKLDVLCLNLKIILKVIFSPYVRKEYKKKEDIVGLIDLNLI